MANSSSKSKRNLNSLHHHVFTLFVFITVLACVASVNATHSSWTNSHARRSLLKKHHVPLRRAVLNETLEGLGEIGGNALGGVEGLVDEVLPNPPAGAPSPADPPAETPSDSAPAPPTPPSTAEPPASTPDIPPAGSTEVPAPGTPTTSNTSPSVEDPNTAVPPEATGTKPVESTPQEEAPPTTPSETTVQPTVTDTPETPAVDPTLTDEPSSETAPPPSETPAETPPSDGPLCPVGSVLDGVVGIGGGLCTSPSQETPVDPSSTATPTEGPESTDTPPAATDDPASPVDPSATITDTALPTETVDPTQPPPDTSEVPPPVTDSPPDTEVPPATDTPTVTPPPPVSDTPIVTDVPPPDSTASPGCEDGLGGVLCTLTSIILPPPASETPPPSPTEQPPVTSGPSDSGSPTETVPPVTSVPTEQPPPDTSAPPDPPTVTAPEPSPEPTSCDGGAIGKIVNGVLCTLSSVVDPPPTTPPPDTSSPVATPPPDSSTPVVTPPPDTSTPIISLPDTSTPIVTIPTDISTPVVTIPTDISTPVVTLPTDTSSPVVTIPTDTSSPVVTIPPDTSTPPPDTTAPPDTTTPTVTVPPDTSSPSDTLPDTSTPCPGSLCDTPTPTPSDPVTDTPTDTATPTGSDTSITFPSGTDTISSTTGTDTSVSTATESPAESTETSSLDQPTISSQFSFLTQSTLLLSDVATTTADTLTTLTDPDAPTTTAILVGASVTAPVSQATLPANLPARIYPPGGVLQEDDVVGFSAISILFDTGLGWKFVATNTDSSAQIFAYFPPVIYTALGLTADQVLTFALQVWKPDDYQSEADVDKLRTVFIAYIPSDKVTELAQQILASQSPFYTRPSGISNELAQHVDRSFVINAVTDPLTNNPDSGASGGAPSSASSTDNTRLDAIIGVCAALGGVALLILLWMAVRNIRRHRELAHRRLSDLPGAASSTPAPGQQFDRDSIGGQRRRSFYFAEDSLRGFSQPPSGADQMYDHRMSPPDGSGMRERRSPIIPGTISAPILRDNTLNW